MIYESLCHELDNLLIEIRNDVEKQIESKIKLQNLMNDGYLNIAKARYINGSSTVSTMQLPTEFSKPLEALATVIRDDIENEPKFKILRRSSLVKQHSDCGDDGLRKRRGKGDELDMKEVGEQTLTDPIRLFGVLVPQALKLAQKSFIEAVSISASVAEIQCKLNAKMKRYSKLLKKKETLKNNVAR